MSGINQIRTIKDLERATYGSLGTNDILKATGATSGIHADHANLATSGDVNLYNLIYGQKVWSMLNREINAMAMLPKKPWSSSGWRVLVERAIGGDADLWSTTGGSGTGAGNRLETEIGGVNENQVFSSGTPDGSYDATSSGALLSPVAPVYETLFVSPKTIAHQFEISELAAAMAKIDDGIGDIMAAYREEVGVTHAEAMNRMLLVPSNALYASAAPLDGWDNNLMGLHRIVSSDGEVTSLVQANSSATNITGATSGANREPLETLYGKDRSTIGAWMDSYVDFGDYLLVASGGAGRRTLTLNMLNSALRELQVRGASPKVILTGYDTIQALGELLQAQERYMGRTEILPTHNGVKGVKGREVGFKVATYHDIPIIPCKEMSSTGEGTDGLSDIFILDTDHLHFATLKPTEYFEGGIDSGDPFGVGKLGNRGLYRTIGEVVCTFVKGQGKITNIK